MFKEYLDEYRAQLIPAIEGLDAEEFGKFIGILADAYRNDRTIFIAGNGGSAGTANHFVCDFGKNAVQEPGKRRFRIVSLCDNIEKITALGNDIEFAEIFRQQLINLMRDGDVLIEISASGNSPDLVRACQYAKDLGNRIVTLTGFAGGKIKAFGDANLVVPLESYEMIEDVHMIIMHMVVYYIKNHPECLDA